MKRDETKRNETARKERAMALDKLKFVMEEEPAPRTRIAATTRL